MPLSDLSAEQQQAFWDRLKELGMDPSQVVAKITPETHQGPVRLSPDGSVSAVPAHILTLSSVDDVKRLAGNADAEYDLGTLVHHHAEFPEWPEDRVALDSRELTPEENRRLVAAEVAYVYGDSRRLKGYRAALDRHKFPVRVAAFAVEDICLDATNSPLVVTADSLHNFGTLTICEGGWIKFNANATLTIQKLVKSDRTKC